MSEVTPDTTTTEAARFVGVAVSKYDSATFTPLPQTVSGVQRVSEILSAYAYEVDVLSEPKESEARTKLRRLLAKDCLPTGGSLIVLWSGHGEPAAEGVLHLIGRDSEPGSAPEVDSGFISGLATRTGASQVLLLFDTCYAGTGVMSAATVARRVLQELPPNAERIWVGVVASALELQPARDGVFLERLTALLKNGPTDPELRLRWSAHSRGVRGDDVIDALLKEWRVSTQQLDAQMSGNAWIMLPNPRYDPHAPEQVVEHLLLAARGGDPGDETSYFSGRVAPLAYLVDWVQAARPGIFVVTGPAGSGKSALVGRLVSLSNPTERARLLAQGPVEHADPGKGSVHAHVHVRGSTVERLVQELNDQLVRAGVLSPRPGSPRNRGDLLGALERSPLQPVIVIDGLDEAASEAWQITSQVLCLLAGNACIIVATRDLAPAEDGPSLAETLAPQDLIDLGDTANRQDATEAVRAYVAKRLADSAAGVMHTAAVAEAIIQLAREEGEGLFLLARVITSQLRAEPLDTSQPGWEAMLSRSVEAAFDRDIERIPPLRRDDRDLPAAARELLTALAWGYGAGLPTDVWAVIATALSATQVQYDREAVYWLLCHAGRYIVEDGEGGYAVYRLSHQRLVEHLHPWPAPPEIDAAQQQAAPVARALVEHYLELLARGLEPETPTYLWQYVWRHCADAGPVVIDALRQLAVTNPAFRNGLASALNSLGVYYSKFGRYHEAVAPTEEAVTLCRQITATDCAFRNNLSMALHNLGSHYSAIGHHHKAIAPTEEAVTFRRELAATNPTSRNDLAGSLTNLGVYYSKFGRYHEAVAPTEEAVTIGRELAATNPAFRNGLASSLTNLGICYSVIGRYHEAVAPTEEAVTIRRELAATNPAFLSDLAGSLTNLGTCYSVIGRYHEAVAPTEEAVTIRRELAATNSAFRNKLASSLTSLGNCYSEIGRDHEAVAPTEEAVTIYRELTATNPAFRNDLAWSLTHLGMHYREIGRYHEAVAPTEEAVTIYRELTATNPAFRNDLAWSLTHLGMHYREIGRYHEAVAPTEEAVTIYRELAVANPAFRNGLASSLTNLGIHYREIGRDHEAVAPTEEAVTIRRELAATNSAFRNKLARSLYNLGNHYSAIGHHYKAIAPTEEAVTIYREFAATNPAFRDDLASSLTNLGVYYSKFGRYHEAVAPTKEAVTIYRELTATNSALRDDLAISLTNLGVYYSEIGHRHEADLVWDDTFRQLADQPSGFAFLASCRALARPSNELPMACTDLHHGLSRNDLPTGSIVKVRKACRELRQRSPSDFDAAWRALTGELPAWLLIDLESFQDTLEWINMPTWRASCDYLHEHAGTLLSDAVQPVFDELEFAVPDDPTIQQCRTLLGAAQQHGIDVAYRELLVGEVVDAWINTDTWAASQAFLDAHHADLTSDEAMAILADRATDGQSAEVIHHTLLTLVRLGQADRAYDAIMDAAQLQAELAAARGDADSTRLIAYATMGVVTASDDADTAQACFHLAIGQALTNDLAINQDFVIKARELAPDQVPVWLGYIGALLGARPDCQATLISLSQTLLAPPPAE